MLIQSDVFSRHDVYFAGIDVITLIIALLDGQTDPNSCIVVDKCKTIILNLACESGQEEIVNMLINSPEYKVNINCQDDTGRTPLMIAVMKGLLNIVHELLKRCC